VVGDIGQGVLDQGQVRTRHGDQHRVAGRQRRPDEARGGADVVAGVAVEQAGMVEGGTAG
jgi:hypothetical protein